MTIKTKLPVNEIILVGMFVGCLDIMAAFVDAWFSFHLSPRQVLNYIASAAIGKNQNSHAIIPAFAGLIFHFFIAICFTFLFYLLYNDLSQFLKRKIFIGIAYGLFIWASMRFVVLPLTQLKLPPFNFIKQIKPALILIFTMGFPLTFIISKIKSTHQEVYIKHTKSSAS